VRAAFWTLLGLAVAFLLASGLSRVSPGAARFFDPFLLVVVYCALVGGENHGMLAGVAAGWIEDVHFGGTLLGLTALTDVLIGFVIGFAGTRFLLAGSTSRLLVLFLATLTQALLLAWSASIFDIPVQALSLSGLLIRSIANSVVGVFAFDLVDARVLKAARV
jgi:rod shape-determining protein MreD